MSDIAPDSRAGSQFGRYHLKRLLGRGGTGEVYEAEDTVKERVVALKLLSPEFSEDPTCLERLRREVSTARRLQEPHAVPINGCGEIDGQLFLETRLIDGTDLATFLEQLGRLSPPRAVAIVRQVAAALDAAHAAGVTHGDVKPQNIIVTRDEFAYLVDFGIADAASYKGASQAGGQLGTWKYTAPERFTDAEVNHRADIYALTCVLCECLTGSPPYPVENPAKMVSAHLMQPIPCPSQLQADVPRAFDDVIARGMAKDPQARYATAGDLALAAYQALGMPDQNRGSDIVERTQVASPPSGDLESPPPHTPPPAPPGDGVTQVPMGDRRAVPPLAPTDSIWLGQFDEFNLRREAARRRRLGLVLGAIAAVMLVVAAGVGIRLLYPSHIRFSVHRSTKPTPSATAPAAPPAGPPAAPPAEVQARLMGLLPAGYQPGVCNPATPSQDALAAVSCGANADLDGPPSATYTLFPDTAKLHSAFHEIVATASVMECPGRIQSPGPWHHNATPDKSSGALLCAIRQGQPTVTWTDDDALLLSVAKTDPPGPTIEQLYGWWMSHS